MKARQSQTRLNANEREGKSDSGLKGIGGVFGKDYEMVGISGVYEAVCVGGCEVRSLARFVNFAVNCIETDSIVNLAVNYFDRGDHNENYR